MPIILAIEPDRRQAAHLAGVVRQRVGAELILATTTEGALDAIGNRVPDMVLVPALLSPQDDAALAAALRVIAAAAHVRTLTIPVLASGAKRKAPGGMLAKWRRGRAESPAPDGCDPAVFADQIKDYLREAAAERAELDELDQTPVVFDETPAVFTAEAPVMLATEAPTALDETPWVIEDGVTAETAFERAIEAAAEVVVEVEPIPDVQPIVLATPDAIESPAEPSAAAPLVWSEPAAFVQAEAIAIDDRLLIDLSDELAALSGDDDVYTLPALVEEPAPEPAPVADTEPWVGMYLTPGRLWPAIEGVLVEETALPETWAESRPAVAPSKSEQTDWAALVASLRQDIERRRSEPPSASTPPVAARPAESGGNGNRPAKKHRAAVKKSKALQDEWGFFDPEQCGFSALLAKLDEITDSPEESDARRPS